ncbi:type IX secretion system membrane protein PorP/SprF [Maribellus comscasis]|uniref:Type IX secretion system membrane protein PorP/SprF n=1 Tax=Maribellus comscasis TaxID=2681766 RepID=A0A6I6JST9_9BACT|nr:type IX secretion system membrane protein PorP/SprF [Maribellus comscasis]QGY45511.1 type IX secretion system membrane protein PorP/SprF [Maribellus comscasis]
MKQIVLRFICSSVLVVILSYVSLGQDPEFSQFFANPLHVNPAFAGTSELPRAVVSYRNQWPQKGATYTTYSISYDQISTKFNSGIGFQLLHDRELNNVVNTSSASFSYSYHLKINQWSFVTMGLQSGLVLKQFNVENLIFSSNIDQLSGEITGAVPVYSDEKKIYPDFSIGAVGQHNKIFWGASAFHINQPNESILVGDQKGKIPIKYTVHAGMRTKKHHNGLLSREFTFSPNLMYQQQGTFKQVNLGIYLIEKSFLLGGWVRNNFDKRPDSIIALAGFARDKFQFGYSFDYTLSKLSDYSFGSHEISLTFFLGRLDGIPVKNKLLIPMI